MACSRRAAADRAMQPKRGQHAARRPAKAGAPRGEAASQGGASTRRCGHAPREPWRQLREPGGRARVRARPGAARARAPLPSDPPPRLPPLTPSLCRASAE
jgi:hypothetical protein